MAALRLITASLVGNMASYSVQCHSVDPLFLDVSESVASHVSTSRDGWVAVQIVHATDVAILRPTLRHMSLPVPFVFGWDFVGETVEDCSAFACGSLVFGFLDAEAPGALTSGRPVLARIENIRAVPADLDAATLCAGIQAMLVAEQVLRKSDWDTRLLILGGNTWLGKFLVQVAKQMFEIEWVAVTIDSEDARAEMEELGADEVYNTKFVRKSSLFACGLEAGRGGKHWTWAFARSRAKRDYTLVVDLVDDPTAKTLLARDGRFVTLARPARKDELKKWLVARSLQTQAVGLLHNFKAAEKRIEAYLPDWDADALDRLAILLGEGRLKVDFKRTALQGGYRRDAVDGVTVVDIQ